MFKKFLLILLSLVIIVVVTLSVLLFTPFGNNILKPQIQKQIDKYSPIPLTLDIFSIRLGSFNIVLNSYDNINIASNGTFSLINQNIDISLDILLKNPLADGASNVAPKELFIENVIKGKITDFEVHTMSNSLNGDFRIDTNVINFKPLKILANIKNIQLETIFALLGKKPYAKGKIDVIANIVGDNNMKFNGQALAKISSGEIVPKLVKEDFNITIPDTSFILNLVANFDGANILHKLELLSNVGNVHSNGSTAIETLNTNSTYDINISNLSPLTPIVGMPLRGKFKTNGKIVGGSKWINFDGKSDVADSDTMYSISLEQYVNPKDVILKVKNLKIEELLYMLVQPIYVDGLLNVNANLNNIISGINGHYTHNVNGEIKGKTIKSEFDVNMPNMDYEHNVNIELIKGSGSLNADITTPAANLIIKNALVNIDSLGVNAPYVLDVKDFKKLAFVTGKELKGNLVANGDVIWTPVSLRGSLKSDIFGGNLDVLINNHLINATIKNMNSIGVLDMLQYPKIFNSTINGDFKYDRQTQIGNIGLILSQGVFSNDNKLMSVLEKVLKFNGTKEIYNNITIDGNINKRLVTANLNMLSNNTSITSNNATLNLDNDNISADLLFNVKGYELYGALSGKATNPNLKIDTSKLGKAIVDEVVKNPKVQEGIQKLEDQAKDIINKGFGNLFK